MKALVTAEVNIEKLKAAIPEMEFETKGYAANRQVMTSEEMWEIISGYDILISEFETISSEVIDAANNLKCIICCRGGFKSVIDVAAAEKKGILVLHNSGRNANAVSEIVMGYILDLCRNITHSDRLIHERKITKSERGIPSEYKDSIWGLDSQSPYVALRGRSPSHMTLGIVGYGNVGKKVAEKAKAFGMKILVCDPFISDNDIPSDIQRVMFDELLGVADIVTLHCSLLPENVNMMGVPQFQAMKNDAFFINAARGVLVDEDALIWALKKGEIAGAAIDVTRDEPLGNDSPLLDAPNLLMTPHIAGASDEVIDNGTNMVIEKLRGFMKKEIQV